MTIKLYQDKVFEELLNENSLFCLLIYGYLREKINVKNGKDPKQTFASMLSQRFGAIKGNWEGKWGCGIWWPNALFIDLVIVPMLDVKWDENCLKVVCKGGEAQRVEFSLEQNGTLKHNKKVIEWDLQTIKEKIKAQCPVKTKPKRTKA
jgi:hypothetical protein